MAYNLELEAKNKLKILEKLDEDTWILICFTLEIVAFLSKILNISRSDSWTPKIYCMRTWTHINLVEFSFAFEKVRKKDKERSEERRPLGSFMIDRMSGKHLFTVF